MPLLPFPHTHKRPVPSAPMTPRFHPRSHKLFHVTNPLPQLLPQLELRKQSWITLRIPVTSLHAKTPLRDFSWSSPGGRINGSLAVVLQDLSACSHRSFQTSLPRRSRSLNRPHKSPMLRAGVRLSPTMMPCLAPPWSRHHMHGRLTPTRPVRCCLHRTSQT